MEHKHRTPITVDEVFQDHRSRRQGMLRALTTEKKKLYQLCDPGINENLSLYSYPDGTWDVSKPADEIPSELPEPCLGINFTRDSMGSEAWLSLVAAHSDAWLIAVAFFHTIRFSKQQRADLFNRVNEFPTLFEVVTGQESAQQNGSARSGANTTKPDNKRKFAKQEVEVDEEIADADEEEDVDEGQEFEEEEEEEEDAFCGACRGSYASSSSQFWILCDVCDRWFHGKCVKITAAKAQQIDKYKCPFCLKKRPHP